MCTARRRRILPQAASRPRRASTERAVACVSHEGPRSRLAATRSLALERSGSAHIDGAGQLVGHLPSALTVWPPTVVTFTEPDEAGNAVPASTSAASAAPANNMRRNDTAELLQFPVLHMPPHFSGAISSLSHRYPGVSRRVEQAPALCTFACVEYQLRIYTVHPGALDAWIDESGVATSGRCDDGSGSRCSARG